MAFLRSVVATSTTTAITTAALTLNSLPPSSSLSSNSNNHNPSNPYFNFLSPSSNRLGLVKNLSNPPSAVHMDARPAPKHDVDFPEVMTVPNAPGPGILVYPLVWAERAWTKGTVVLSGDCPNRFVFRVVERELGETKARLEGMRSETVVLWADRSKAYIREKELSLQEKLKEYERLVVQLRKAESSWFQYGYLFCLRQVWDKGLDHRLFFGPKFPDPLFFLEDLEKDLRKDPNCNINITV